MNKPTIELTSEEDSRKIPDFIWDFLRPQLMSMICDGKRGFLDVKGLERWLVSAEYKGGQNVDLVLVQPLDQVAIWFELGVS